MANALESYVEKFILNPERSTKFDEIDEDDATAAKVSEKIEGPEGKEGAGISASKLRMKNAPTLSDRDPRYKAKKISRSSLKPSSERDSTYDPDLAKYFLEQDIEEESSEEQSDESNEEDEDIDYAKALKTNSFNEFDKDEFSSEESSGDELKETDEESSASGCADDEVLDQEESPQTKTINIDESDLVEKSVSVKNQFALYDSLFEFRIALQKVVTSANRLPQHDQYKLFFKEDNGLYKKNLQAARASTKKLLGSLVDLHEVLLLRNPEARYIATEESPDSNQDSDEEIPSSEGEEEDKPRPPVPSPKAKKRKVEEVEHILSKRHKAFNSLRDSTLVKWHEKVKLLFGQNRDKFTAFDVSPIQQLTNLLANKEHLIKRTQLVGISRGNTFRVLGKEENAQEAAVDEHDPEIFDDGDFYSRILEEVLKSKMSLTNDMTDVSRRWIEIQNLRKRAKKKVDTKASKGRKIRYDVMTKLQQYLAPCKPSTMDDGAMNMLFGSLFGASLKS